MDPFQFAVEASRAGVGYMTPFFPGNALPRDATPSFPDSTKLIPVGIQTGESSWDDFIKKAVSKTVSATETSRHMIHSALSEVAGAPARAKNFMKRTEESVVSAATGFVSWTKWVVAGLAIVLVLYIASFVRRSL